MKSLSNILTTVVAIGFLGIYAMAMMPPSEVRDLAAPVGIIEISLDSFPDKFVGHGSGAFISSTKFLTAGHVVKELTTIDIKNPITGRIRMEDGTIFKIHNIAKASVVDLAIVTIQEEYTGYIPPLVCEDAKRGTTLTTIGAPLSFEFVETKIMVSGGVINADIKESKTQQQTEPQTYSNILDSPNRNPPRLNEPKRRFPKDLKLFEETKEERQSMNVAGTEFFQGIALPGQSGSPVFTDDGNIIGVITITITEDKIGSFTGLGLYVKTSSACGFLTGLTTK